MHYCVFGTLYVGFGTFGPVRSGCATRSCSTVERRAIRSGHTARGTTHAHDWPKSPIWPEDLPLIRELLTDEEYAELLRRMVQVVLNGPLLGYPQVFGEPSKN